MSADQFAFRLKELLEHKKLTLQAVANALGVSRPAVHKWTKGGEIDYANLRKLAAFLNVNWLWLRYGEDSRKAFENFETVDLPMTDVRRKYTEEIMENEARLKLAHESARIVTWEWNLVTNVIKYSRNVESVYGWKISNQEDFDKHTHPEDQEMMNKAYQKSIETGEPHEFDFRIFPPEGGVRWISSRGTPIRDVEGRMVKIIGISMDTTARKAVEESLSEQHSRLTAVINHSSDGMALIGPDWKWEAVNKTFIDLTGRSETELRTLRFPELLARREAALEHFVKGNEQSCDFNAEIVRKDGTKISVNIRAVQRSGHGNQQPYLILACRPR
jgi:PAS domain S-box-containing protein